MPSVYGYGRGSTIQQVITLEAQEMRCVQHFRYKREIGQWGEDYQWLGFFADAATCRASIFRDRPYGNYVFTHLKRGDVLLVADFDRGFGGNTIDFLTTTKDLNDRGVVVVSLDMNLDSSNNAHMAMMTSMAGFKEYERKNAIKRITDANDYLISKGMPTSGASFGKLGWKIKKVKRGGGKKPLRIFVEDTELRAFADELAALRESGMSVERIRNHLIKEKRLFDKKGKEWTFARLRHLIRARELGWPKVGAIRSHTPTLPARLRRPECESITDS